MCECVCGQVKVAVRVRTCILCKEMWRARTLQFTHRNLFMYQRCHYPFWHISDNTHRRVHSDPLDTLTRPHNHFFCNGSWSQGSRINLAWLDKSGPLLKCYWFSCFIVTWQDTDPNLQMFKRECTFSRGVATCDTSVIQRTLFSATIPNLLQTFLSSLGISVHTLEQTSWM